MRIPLMEVFADRWGCEGKDDVQTLMEEYFALNLSNQAVSMTYNQLNNSCVQQKGSVLCFAGQPAGYTACSFLVM